MRAVSSPARPYGRGAGSCLARKALLASRRASHPSPCSCIFARPASSLAWRNRRGGCERNQILRNLGGEFRYARKIACAELHLPPAATAARCPSQICRTACAPAASWSGCSMVRWRRNLPPSSPPRRAAASESVRLSRASRVLPGRVPSHEPERGHPAHSSHHGRETLRPAARPAALAAAAARRAAVQGLKSQELVVGGAFPPAR